MKNLSFTHFLGYYRLQRLEDIEKLPPKDKNNIYYTLDNLIKAAKLKSL